MEQFHNQILEIGDKEDIVAHDTWSLPLQSGLALKIEPVSSFIVLFAAYHCLACANTDALI
jgi:hypothetical protein